MGVEVFLVWLVCLRFLNWGGWVLVICFGVLSGFLILLGFDYVLVLFVCFCFVVGFFFFILFFRFGLVVFCFFVFLGFFSERSFLSGQLKLKLQVELSQHSG